MVNDGTEDDRDLTDGTPMQKLESEQVNQDDTGGTPVPSIAASLTLAT